MTEGEARPRVMVCDDDPDIVTLLSDLLEANGYDPQTAPDGLEGIIEGLEHPIDLVILDVMMPHADGLSVLNTLKAAHQDVPIIMLTAKTAPEDVAQGYEWGCDAYVTKPFDPDHLLSEVARLLAERPR